MVVGISRVSQYRVVVRSGGASAVGVYRLSVTVSMWCWCTRSSGCKRTVLCVVLIVSVYEVKTCHMCGGTSVQQSCMVQDSVWGK